MEGEGRGSEIGMDEERDGERGEREREKETERDINLPFIFAALSLQFCQVCHNGENESLLLLCDGCDKGTHTYCCKV